MHRHVVCGMELGGWRAVGEKEERELESPMGAEFSDLKKMITGTILKTHIMVFLKVCVKLVLTYSRSKQDKQLFQNVCLT